jgi:hypothetical protein
VYTLTRQSARAKRCLIPISADHGVTLWCDRERNRRFRRLPEQSQGSFVAAIGSQINFERLDRSAECLQIHFRAAKIERGIVIEMELARLLVDDEHPFCDVGKSPDAVASGG